MKQRFMKIYPQFFFVFIKMKIDFSILFPIHIKQVLNLYFQ